MASVEISSLKRPRDEAQISELEETKRHKSYNHILSILDDEEEEPTQDLSSLITTLQQELSSSDAGFDPLPSEIPPNFEDSSSTSSLSNEGDDKEKVIRHLLEASDDELGIPNTDVAAIDEIADAGDGFLLCDGLWEFEDEAANYYTLLQSELFM